MQFGNYIQDKQYGRTIWRSVCFVWQDEFEWALFDDCPVFNIITHCRMGVYHTV